MTREGVLFFFATLMKGARIYERYFDVFGIRWHMGSIAGLRVAETGYFHLNEGRLSGDGQKSGQKECGKAGGREQPS
jgi:hypothetical protein